MNARAMSVVLAGEETLTPRPPLPQAGEGESERLTVLGAPHCAQSESQFSERILSRGRP